MSAQVVAAVGQDSSGNTGPNIPILVTLSGGGGGSTANQGTPNTLANAWPIKFTDGSNVVTISSGAPVGNAMATSSGAVFQTASLTASGSAAGTSVDMGSARSNWSMMVVAGTGVTAGTVTLQLSLDGTVWADTVGKATLTAAGNTLVAATGIPARYGRANAAGITGGTVSANLMAAG